MEALATADTQEHKSRAAESFTSYYESRGVEDAIVGFYRHVALERGGARRGDGARFGDKEGYWLLRLLGDQSEGDVRLLTWLAVQVTGAMIRASFVGTVYDRLKGGRLGHEAQPATDCLLALSKLIQTTLVDYADGCEKWAKLDVEKIVTRTASTDTREDMATAIKAHLDSKYDWFTWNVIIQDAILERGSWQGDFIEVRMYRNL